MPSTLCYFEIPADDPENVKAFYERISDWKLRLVC